MADFGFEERDGEEILWTRRALGPSFLTASGEDEPLLTRLPPEDGICYYKFNNETLRDNVVGLVADFFGRNRARAGFFLVEAHPSAPDGWIEALGELDMVYNPMSSILSFSFPLWDVDEVSPYTGLISRLVKHPSLSKWRLTFNEGSNVLHIRSNPS